MPLRNPVILAKELATLQFLSNNRVVLGAGVGWNDAEYEAVGVSSRSGKRTDEMLDIMLPLLEGETVTYHGRYYSVDDVFIEPRTRSDRRCGSVVGRSWRTRSRLTSRSSSNGEGAPSAPMAASRGRRARHPISGETGTSCRRSSARTAPTRPSCPWPTRTSASRADERPGQGARGAAPRVPQGDERRARAEYLETVYLFGTPTTVALARVDAGVEQFILHTMTPDPKQLQAWVAEHLEPSGSASAGSVRKPNRDRVAVPRDP